MTSPNDKPVSRDGGVALALFAAIASLTITLIGLWLGLGWYSLAFAVVNALADYAIWKTR